MGNECGVVLPNDSGSDFVCTEEAGHEGDHCDNNHPFSWEQATLRLVQGRAIKTHIPITQTVQKRKSRKVKKSQ